MVTKTERISSVLETSSEVLDADRQVSAEVAIVISIETNATAEPEAQIPRRIEFRIRRQVGDDLVDAQTSAAHRMKLEARWKVDSDWSPWFPVDVGLANHGASAHRFDRSAGLSRSVGKDGGRPLSIAHHDKAVEIETCLNPEIDRSVRSILLLRRRRAAAQSALGACVRDRRQDCRRRQTGHQERTARIHDSDCYWGNLKTGLIRR